MSEQQEMCAQNETLSEHEKDYVIWKMHMVCSGLNVVQPGGHFSKGLSWAKGVNKVLCYDLFSNYMLL